MRPTSRTGEADMSSCAWDVPSVHSLEQASKLVADFLIINLNMGLAFQ